MDREQLKQNIAKYYRRLSARAQDSFSSLKWLEELNTITQKYGLENSQVQDVTTETMLGMLGIISLDEYEYFVLNNLNLPKEKAYQMLVDIDKAIFANLRVELLDVYDINSKETDELEEKDKDESFPTNDDKDDLSANIDFILSGGK